MESKISMYKIFALLRFESIKPAIIFYLGACLALISIQSLAGHKIGWLEPVLLQASSANEFVLEAKIDSGADHSSLHATQIHYEDIEGLRYVSFTTVKGLIETQPVVRVAKIKTKDGGVQERAVIKLKICLDGVVREVAMNLVDRSHFSKALLLGRSALGGFLIDVSQTHLSDIDKCRGKF